MRRVLAALLLLALAVVVAACDGGDDAAAPETTGTAPGFTPPEVLTVASDIPRVPFAFAGRGSEEPRGFDVDLVTEIARRAGIERVRFVDLPADAIVDAVEGGRVGMSAAGWTITPELAARVDFGDQYFSANPAVLVRSGDEVASLDDLSGRVIGAQRVTVGADLAETVVGASVRRYPTVGAAVAALSRGEVDAVIADFPDVAWAAARRPGLEVAAEVPGEIGLGLMFPREAAGLRDAFDAGLQEVRDDGTYDELYRRWFGEGPPPAA